MATHIDSTPHENGASGQVYHYEADFVVLDSAITWQAVISQGEVRHCTLAGEIPATTPALATLAEQVVRDAIVKRIDTFDDQQSGADPVGTDRGG